MSSLAPNIQPRQRVAGAKQSFVMIASQFNARYVQGLVNHATAELRLLAPMATLALHQVPGAFEIPITAREIALRKTADVIIALGVILEGETTHAEHLARSVTDALQRVALDHGVPVIHAVLSLKNVAQAEERCLGEKINRGTEAARAAVEILNVLGEVRAK